MILLILALVIGLGILYFVVSVLVGQQYWEKNNVYTLKNRVPFLGHMGRMMLQKQALPSLVQDFYEDMKSNGKDYGGVYMLQKRFIMIKNTDLIAEITIRHFENFMNKQPFFDPSVDRLLGRSLIGLKNEEWREMRHTLSPAFTGSKLRGMIGLIESSSDRFSDFLSNRPDPNEPLNIFESFRRLAADLIATTAFGSLSDSINNPESEFYKNGSKLMDFSGRRTLVLTAYMLFPALMKILNIPFVPKSLSTFFLEKILSTIQYREKENKSRADMIQLLLDARRADPTKDIPNDAIASQAILFFIGGFDTIATAFSFISHSLAMHPEIQAKVRHEILEVKKSNGGKISYESLTELKYMEMVISEVLRMHPTLPMIDRQCTKNVSIPNFGLSMEKGDLIWIPVYGLHFDPDNFPDPQKFDPERFSEENKPNIKPFTYMPFGEGPRNCLGKRFAILELKLVLSMILSKHELQVCEKTNVSVPFEYTKQTAVMQPEGGFWLNIKPLVEE